MSFYSCLSSNMASVMWNIPMKGQSPMGQILAFLFLGALDQTTEWIKESVNEELLSLSETALTPGAENSSKPSLSPTVVLNNSYLKLLQWDYKKKDLPEVSNFFSSPKFSNS